MENTEKKPITINETASFRHRLSGFLHALIFVLGFSVVFVIGWGGALTLFGQIFALYKTTLAKIGGLVIIVFGLVTLRVINIPWLQYDIRLKRQKGYQRGLFFSGLMGVFFAAGWTPCVGATLGAILTLGFSQETIGQAMLLSGFYAIGMGIPFLAIGVGVQKVTKTILRFRRYLRGIQIASGLLLLLIGIMILTEQSALLATWAQRNGLYLDLPIGVAATPTIFIALIAGLLSFLSPCVLPLVPAYIGYLSGHELGGMQYKDKPPPINGETGDKIQTDYPRMKM
jgi:cytochrome c-type biogenesis protein